MKGPYVCYGGSCSEVRLPDERIHLVDHGLRRPHWAAANPGQEVDWDVGLNNTSGTLPE